MKDTRRKVLFSPMHLDPLAEILVEGHTKGDIATVDDFEAEFRLIYLILHKMISRIFLAFW